MEAILSDEFKAFFGFKIQDHVLVNSTGFIRVNMHPWTAGFAGAPPYAMIHVGEKDVAVARIIYAAFHPEAIGIFRNGCRINLVRPLRLREGTSLVRNHLEDLILEPLTQRPERPLGNEASAIHPSGYGDIIYGAPYPLMFKNN